jgi:hypothetical protein
MIPRHLLIVRVILKYQPHSRTFLFPKLGKSSGFAKWFVISNLLSLA